MQRKGETRAQYNTRMREVMRARVSQNRAGYNRRMKEYMRTWRAEHPKKAKEIWDKHNKKPETRRRMHEYYLKHRGSNGVLE